MGMERKVFPFIGNILVNEAELPSLADVTSCIRIINSLLHYFHKITISFPLDLSEVHNLLHMYPQPNKKVCICFGWVIPPFHTEIAVSALHDVPRPKRLWASFILHRCLVSTGRILPHRSHNMWVELMPYLNVCFLKFFNSVELEKQHKDRRWSESSTLNWNIIRIPHPKSPPHRTTSLQTKQRLRGTHLKEKVHDLTRGA